MQLVTVDEKLVAALVVVKDLVDDGVTLGRAIHLAAQACEVEERALVDLVGSDE